MLISVQYFAKSPMSYGIFMVPFLSISSVYISYENVQPNPDSIQGLQILEVLVRQMNQKACTGKRQLHCRPRMAQTVQTLTGYQYSGQQDLLLALMIFAEMEEAALLLRLVWSQKSRRSGH